MTKNPFINAVAAFLYILLGVTIMKFVTEPLQDKPDTFFAPIVFLSTLTLSVAVMAYLFFYQPVLLLIEGKKKDAVIFFVKTVGVFGAITIVVLTLLYFGIV